VAVKYPIRCEQGATLSLVLNLADPVAKVRAVTDEANPTVTTVGPHGLAIGDEVTIVGVRGALGLNNNNAAPVWTVASVPTLDTFTVTAPAPGTYSGGGTVTRPRDLTGSTARMHVRATIDAAETLMEATTATGEFAFETPAGSAVMSALRLTVADEVTATLGSTAGVDPYRYDIEVEAADGSVDRVVEGPFAVSPEVTR
jgi:hypothetical protein